MTGARRYGLLHSLYLSFFSGELYRDVIIRWRGLGFTYLLVLLSLNTIPGVMELGSSFSGFVAADAPVIVRQIPPMTIVKGRLSVGAKQPYFIMDENGKNILAIIDTTGAHKAIEGTTALALLTETQIIIRQDTAPPRTLELSDLGDLVIDRRIVFDWLDRAEELFPLIVYPIALVFSLVLHGALSLMLGITAYGATRFTGLRLSLQPMIRLAAVAMTPSVIAGTVLAAADGRPPFWWAAGLTITTGYMLFGIRALTGVDGLDTDADGPV